jgi:glycosyltransferase involved in cell wall biosynthesis
LVLLSILTPSRNYGSFLPDALQSVAGQRDDAVEHIVVDGASTDDTVEILRAWSHRVRFVSEPDQGQSDALNKAATMADGEWLGWLNADEFYLPGAFGRLCAALTHTPGADVVYGDCCFVDQTGQLLRLVPQHRFAPRILRWYGPFMSSCATFIRKNALPERGWDPGLRRVMDWDLFLELHHRGALFAHVKSPLAAFRLHHAQVTAVHLRSWVGEGLRVRARHDLAASPWLGGTLHALGRVDHGLRKLADGAYSRQAVVRRTLRGADLRWFASSHARANAERLVRVASRPTYG